MAKRHLGLLGPIIVIVGAAVAGLGTWYVIHARPSAGEVIDTFPIGNNSTLVVRGESNGEHSFLELHSGDQTLWQAYIPHYAGTSGRPALAWGPTAVTVRVERNGRAEVFALAMRDSLKLGGFRLAPEHEPITTQLAGPITLTDHIRSYEIVGGSNWHQLVAIDLRTGNALWKVDLGPAPIVDGSVEGAHITLNHDHPRYFNVFNGREDRSLD